MQIVTIIESDFLAVSGGDIDHATKTARVWFWISEGYNIFAVQSFKNLWG